MLKDLINGSIEKFFSNLAESCINMFMSLLAALNQITIQVLDIPVVDNTILYMQGLAGSILITKFSFEIWMNNIMRNNGDSEADVQGVLFRLVQAAAMVGAVPWLTKNVYAWGTAIATDIAGLDASSNVTQGGAFLTDLLRVVMTGVSGTIVIVAAIIVFALVIFLIVLVQTFIRAAELAVVAAAGSFMALGLTNSNSQSFQTWWRELLNISLAQAVQIFMLKCAFFVITPSFINDVPALKNTPLANLMLFVGFIWVTYKSPAILKQYVYSTGVGRASGQAAQQVGSMVIMRKLMTKGAA